MKSRTEITDTRNRTLLITQRKFIHLSCHREINNRHARPQPPRSPTCIQHVQPYSLQRPPLHGSRAPNPHYDMRRSNQWVQRSQWARTFLSASRRVFFIDEWRVCGNRDRGNLLRWAKDIDPAIKPKILIHFETNLFHYFLIDINCGWGREGNQVLSERSISRKVYVANFRNAARKLKPVVSSRGQLPMESLLYNHIT